MLAPVIAGPGALALLKLFALLQLIVHCVAGVEDSVCVSSQQSGRCCLSAVLERGYLLAVHRGSGGQVVGVKSRICHLSCCYVCCCLQLHVFRC